MSNWTQPTGTTLLTTNEEETVSLGLPLAVGISPTIEIIAGALPPGLRIYQNNIIGTPLQVERTTTFTFVLRATVGTNIDDRTYRIVIEGPDDPIWKTKEGRLPYW